MSILRDPIFHDEKAAYAYVESILWPDGPVCPKCDAADSAYELKGKRARPGLRRCKECKKDFTVKVGTVFEASHVSMCHWLQATYLMCASKKGFSAHQLHRTLGVTYKTAWFMFHRLREAMRSGDLAPFGANGGIVEVDETFIGHDQTIKPKHTKKGRGYAHKHKVLALVDRNTGRAKSMVVDDLKAKTLVPILKENISKEATVYTDEAGQYRRMDREFADHAFVRHGAGEWGRGPIHTNTIEGYFSIFKRGMKGVYQHCAKKHLHRYAAEFEFRYNHRTANGFGDVRRSESVLSSAQRKQTHLPWLISGRLVRPRAEVQVTKQLSVTVHPAPVSSDYLTVSDALYQVLDLVDALERVESTAARERQIVWRLTGAHTHSPPFTVMAEPFPVQPNLSIELEAGRVTTLFSAELSALLEGKPSAILALDAQGPISHALERNMNGIARTEIQFGEDEPICISPHSARVAKLAIGQVEMEVEASKPDWQRTEYGAVEGEISGLTRWNGKPALVIAERLSEKRFTCVLSGDLSQEVGPTRQWSEVWEGRWVNVSGALHYNSDGDLRRAEITHLEEIQWADVPLSDLQGIDVLNGRSVSEHLAFVRGESDG